jgi:hypothetical protein
LNVRIFLSLVLGLVLGGLIGLFVGWVVLPVEYVNSDISDLAPQYQETYTVMVASGYIADGDALGAVERLRSLGVDNVPAYVQDLTERYITNSRDIDDIRRLVALAEGLGRLTPPMENFRQYSEQVAQP